MAFLKSVCVREGKNQSNKMEIEVTQGTVCPSST